MAYCTPTLFWQTRTARTLRPEDFEAGEVSAVVRTGGGDGVVQVTRAYPKDAWAAALRITLSGELGVARYVYALDGATWSAELTIPGSGAVPLPGLGAGRLEDSGLEVTFADGALNPSFVLNAVYSFSTTASPTIRLLLQEASDELDEAIGTDLALPLTGDIGAHLPGKTADIALYKALRARGYDPQASHNREIRQGYEDALRWAASIREKMVRLKAGESGAAVAGIRASSRPSSGWGAIRGRHG